MIIIGRVIYQSLTRKKLNNIKGDIKVIKSGIYVAEKMEVFELMKSNNLDTVKCKLMDARARCIMRGGGGGRRGGGQEGQADDITRRTRKETEKGTEEAVVIFT